MSFQLRNESTGEIHALEEKRIAVGSADSGTIVIKDPGVPPTQCFLSKTKLGYFLMSFQPDSLIPINDVAVKEKMLKPGDRIRIGETLFHYEEAGAPAAEAPAPAPAPAAGAEPAPQDAPTPEPAPEEPSAPAAEQPPPAAQEAPPPWETTPEPGADAAPEETPAAAPAPASAPAPWEVAPEVPAEAPAGEAGPEPLSPAEAEQLLGGSPAPAAPEDAPAEEERFRLKVHGGARDGELVAISGRLTVGRADECDLVLLASSVSRRHAEFEVRDGTLFVRDLGSASGVRVNGAKVKEDQVSEGDQVEVGDIILVVKQAAVPPDAGARPGAEVSGPAPEEPRSETGPSAAAVKPLLLVMGGDQDGKILPVDGRLDVGSAPECGLCLSDPDVKTSHAEFVEDAGALSIRPLAGVVKVNGAEIGGEEPLSKGDAVEFGKVLVVVRASKTKAREEAAPAPPEEPAPSEEPAAPEAAIPADEEPPELVIGPEAEAPGAAAGEESPAHTPPMGVVPESGPSLAEEDAKFRLVIKGGKMDGKSFPVTGVMTIGRDSNNTIVLLDTAVSRHHAKVAPEEGGVRITDTGSTGGIWVNGKKVTEGLLSHGDLLRIGHTEIQIRDLSYDLMPETEKPPLPSSLNAVKLSREEVPSSERFVVTFLRGEDEGCHYELRGSAAIGRHKSCDIVIHSEEASGKHAEILLDGPRPLLKDHGSTNGTKVNGIRVAERILFHGDVIEIADAEMLFREPGKPVPAAGVRRPSLLVRERGTEKTVRVRLALQAVVGRDEAASVALRDAEVSTEHAMIFEREGAYYIKDLGSTNGTKINGTRIHVETRLNHGDALTIGFSTITFKEADRPLPALSGQKTSPMTLAAAFGMLVILLGILGFIFKDTLFPPSQPSGNGDTPANAGPANLLQNGSFEEGEGGWQLPGAAQLSTDAPRDGKQCLRILPPAGQDAPLEVRSSARETVSAQYYQVRAAVRTLGSKGYAGVRLRWTDGSRPVAGIPDSYTELLTGTTGDWIELEETFRAPAKPEGVGVLDVELALVVVGAAGETCFDAVEFRRLSEPGFKLRDRPELRTTTDLYTLRAGDSGVFTMDVYGTPFLRDGRLALERPAGAHGASQDLCSVTQGPVLEGMGKYRMNARMLDFASGEEAEFEQSWLVTAQEEIEIAYFVRRLPAEGGYEPVLVLDLPVSPERFVLFDDKNRTWDFPAAFDRKTNIVEVGWAAPNASVVLGLEPACAVETRPAAGGGLALRILPPLAAGARIKLVFRKTSNADTFEIEQRLREIKSAVEQGRLGAAIRLCRAFLEKFEKAGLQRTEIQNELDRLVSEGSRSVTIFKERWQTLLATEQGMEEEARLTALRAFVQEAAESAARYEGSEFAASFEEIHAQAQGKIEAHSRASVEDLARQYLDPAAAAVERGEFLAARILMDSLRTQSGILENLPEALEAQYKSILDRLVDRSMNADPAKMLEQAQEYLRAGDKQKARELCRTIIGLFPDHTEDTERYSEFALKAYKILQGIK